LIPQSKTSDLKNPSISVNPSKKVVSSMADAGIFSLTSLVAGAIGAVMTGPVGHVELPEKPFMDVFASPSGYSLRIEDATGASMGRLRSTEPMPIDLDQIPRDFIGAVMAAEDKRFTEHSGLDPFGLASAALETARGRLRGGSGITQQMVKNAAVGPEVSYERKIAEAVLAVRAHDYFGSRDVLRLYLENAWFGRGESGAANAPQAWFGKDWKDVSLAEAAYLAALLKGPARYDGWRRPEAAKARRDWIIGRMLENGWIEAEQAEAAVASPLGVIPPDEGTTSVSSRWGFSAAAWQMARDDIARSGAARLSIKLTLDPAWGAIVEDELRKAISRIPGGAPLASLGPETARLAIKEDGTLEESAWRNLQADMARSLPQGSDRKPLILLSRDGDDWISAAYGDRETRRIPTRLMPPGIPLRPGDVLGLSEDGGAPRLDALPGAEGAVVLMDPRTGAILASVGGSDPGLSSFDRTRAMRQPGSTAKAFLWLAALDAGMRPDTEIADVEQTYIQPDGTSWSPRNYDRSQSGAMTLFNGLERSSNLVAAALADFIGIDAMADMAEAAGAWRPGQFDRTPAASLGTSETTLIQLVSGYASIVNDAIPRPSHVILRAEDERGKIIVNMAAGIRPLSMNAASSPIASRFATADLLSMLRGVVVRGTASSALGGAPVAIAGKTGSSQDYRDAWFVGVTPHLAIGVWVGRDDARPLPDRLTGGRVAAPIAARILERGLEAGLIDANGYRDRLMSSGAEWPPSLLQSSSWAPSISPRGQAIAPEPAAEPPRQAEETSTWGSSGGGFWGLVDEDRNGDLRPGPQW
jgi:penicillin-binding protein 1A